MGEHCPWIVQAGQQAYEWEPIATLGDCTEDGPSPRSKAFRRVQADARLIAAAPELLAALEEFCLAAEYWAGCDEDCTPDDAISEIMRSGGAWPACAYDKARATISKARTTVEAGQ